MSSLRAGKLPPEMLERLLSRIEVRDPRVLLGPKVGEDAALIDFGDTVLAVKSDPVTFATDLIGWYAVQVNANDIACMGARPRWFVASLLLPEGAGPDAAGSIFDQMASACRSLDITLVGGHTEVTYDLPRPILVGAMLGEVDKGKEVTTGGVRLGDRLVLTKGIAIEGTALLAREATEHLERSGVGPDAIRAAQELLFKPGISVVKEALTSCNAVEVHALHDPTEGGLATGIHEMASASGAGVLVREARVRILPETAILCKALKLHPLGLLASGALLIAVAAEDLHRLLAALRAAGVDAEEIGEAVPVEEGVSFLTTQGTRKPLPRFERDELARFFAPGE